MPAVVVALLLLLSAATACAGGIGGPGFTNQPLTLSADLAVNASPNFVGVVSGCVGGLVVDGATGCSARATQFGGFTAPPNSYFILEGRYVAASPGTTTDGFKVTGARMTNRSCGTDTGKCGNQISLLSAALNSLMVTYNGLTPGLSRGARIIFSPGDYLTSFQNWATIAGNGTVLDACEGPVTLYDDVNDAVDQSLGTGTVTLASGISNTVVMNSQVCGTGSGATLCLDGDEKVRPGYNLLFAASDWYANSGSQYKVVAVSTDGLTITFTPYRTASYSGTVRVEANHLLEFNNQSPATASGPLDLFQVSRLECGWNFMVVQRGHALPVNLYPSAQRTVGAGYRTIPATLVMGFFTWMNWDGGIVTPCGPGDSAIATATSNLGTQTYTNMSITGNIGGCGGWDEQKLAIAGPDPAVTTDDPPSAAIFNVGPGLRVQFAALNTEQGRVLWCERCSLADLNFQNVEDASQLLKINSWFQNVNIRGLSQEQVPRCGTNWPSNSACLAGANIPAFIDIDTTISDTASFAALLVEWANTFSNSEMRPVFLKLKALNQVRVYLNGALASGNTALDVSAATSKSVFSGHLQLQNMTSTAAPGIADFSDLIVQDQNGGAIAW